MRPARIKVILTVRTRKLTKSFDLNNFKVLRKTTRVAAEALLVVSIVLSWPRTLSAQHTPPTASEVEAFVKRAHSELNPGKQVRVPDWILKQLMAGVSASSPDCGTGNRSNLEAHQILLGPNLLGGLAILGQGGCFCSPTGNCALWIYQLKDGKYRMILKLGSVQLFGFLKSQTHGYPDLITCSHGSATEHWFGLFRFNGDRYVASGGWDEQYEYLDDHGQVVELDKPRIISGFSGKDQLPNEAKP
jgi:hypothetical protein